MIAFTARSWPFAWPMPITVSPLFLIMVDKSAKSRLIMLGVAITSTIVLIVCFKTLFAQINASEKEIFPYCCNSLLFEITIYESTHF